MDVQRLVQIIASVMPADAEINEMPADDSFALEVRWRLNNDPDRPNKKSKTIRISVSREAATDFADLSDANQVAAYERIAQFLATKLARYDPNHNAPKYEPPPVEVWLVGTNVLHR